LLALIVVLAAGLTGAFVTQAVGQGDGFSLGPWSGGWHHGGIMGGLDGPASIEEHADRAVQHLAIEVDATAEQQDKLRAIVIAAAKDLQPVHDQARAAHQQAHDLLTQPTIDRAALEKVRSEQIARWDAASKRITQAIGDAAEVLTPEQRQKLGKLMSHGRHHG
jgi:Spy/CpxP family protein refolding chaperone